MADNTNTNTNITAGSTQYIYPNYWEPLAQNASNFAAALPEQYQNTYQNWYNQPLAAAPSANTQQAYQTAQQANPWVPQVQQAAGGLQQSYQPMAQQAQGMYQTGSTYDPNQLQQFLNPYTQNAAAATTAASNKNLFNTVIPGVNTTFAGTGQFGSTRNADFMNRAISDQQQNLTNALGTLNYGAYQNAQQNYSDWANKQQAAAQGIANLGKNQMDYANTLAGLAGSGAALDQQALTNLMTTGKAMEGLQQNEYDKLYSDWMTQQKYPTEMMGGLGAIVGNMAKGVQPDVYNQAPQATDAAKVAAALGVLQSGLGDTDIQSLLGSLGFTFGA